MMSPSTAHFRRIVLDMQPGLGDEGRLRQIAELARLLNIGIHGLFIEDEGLLSLAALPFAREIRLPTFEWQKLDMEQMTADLQHAAARVRLKLEEAARNAGVPSSFETLRGACPLPHCYCAGDIVVERAPGQGEAAADTGYTLLMPARPRRQSGPFTALLRPGDMAVLDIACRFALAAHEELLILSSQDAGAMGEAVNHAVSQGMPRSRIAHMQIGTTATRDILTALGGFHQRFIVMAQPERQGDAWQIAAALDVPVLLVKV